MRLAVVGWASDSGVGRELLDAVRHLPVQSAFIFEHQSKKTRLDLMQGVEYHVARNGQDLRTEMIAFLDKHKPDTVLTWEVPGDWRFPDIWCGKGIRWIHVVHMDWFAPDYMRLWRAAVLVAPYRACQAELQDVYSLKSVFLPVPIDTEKLVYRRRGICRSFASMYGHGGLENRRSIPEILDAWEGMDDAPPLMIRAQERPCEINPQWKHPKVTVEIVNVPETSDLWQTVDVAVQPSRYEGVGLGLLEAQACGVPVITTDAAPMNEVAPDLLVPIEKIDNIVHMGRRMSAFIPSASDIRSKVLQLNGENIGDLSEMARRRVETLYSWNILKPKWIEILKIP
jgi:glycosyltransferase involved in cell wall biosynthesis